MLARSDRAVEVGLEYLRRAGVDWSVHPVDRDVREEYEGIGRRLAERSIESLIDLPRMTDPAALATMEVLTKLMPSTMCIDDKFRFLLIMRMVNLSLESGTAMPRAADTFGWA